MDLQSQMFFVPKNGLQCLKFVCDPPLNYLSVETNVFCAASVEFTRSPALLLLQFIVALGFLLQVQRGLKGQTNWERV